MCGRYTLRKPGILAKSVYQHGFEEFSEIKINHKFVQPRFNISPSQQIVIVRSAKESGTEIASAKWGFTPSYTKGKPKFQPINAKAETVATSGMFKRAFNSGRCLIPADGYYEWKPEADGKTPFFFHLPHDGMFWFAGIWERWHETEDHAIDTAALITTEPNKVQAPIHDRMPVILTEETAAVWMDGDRDPDELQRLLRPYDGRLDVREVSRAVNSPRNDTPENVVAVK